MGAWAILAVLLMLQAPPGPGVPSCNVSIYGDGWASVDCRLPSPGRMEVEVPLLGGADALLASDGEGNPLNHTPLPSSGAVLVEAADADVIVVSYQTPDLTAKSDGLWTASAEAPPNWTVRLTLPRGAVVLGVDPYPESLLWNDSTPILTFSGGFSVDYALPPPERGGNWWGLVPPLAAAAAAAAAAYLLARRVGRRRSESTGERPRLSLDDVAVLRYVAAAGGSAYQSEIRASLGMPKTTLWRRLKRLEAAGLVRLEGTPEGHLVVLTEEGRGLAGLGGP